MTDAATNRKASPVVRGGLICAMLAAVISTGGCDIGDSFLDPSNTGRWEHTPVVLPILDRLDVLEEPEQVIPGLSQPTSEDLVPEITEYTMGPGDLITVTVFELITPNVESVQTRRIDELGFIRLPVIGQVKASGLSTKQLEQQIINILHPNILRNPTVTVIVQEGRQKTFSVIGAVGSVGTYTLLKSDFRLLDAIALARGFPDDLEKFYVIRQVPLVDVVEGRQYNDDASHTPPLRPSGEGATDEPGAGTIDTGQLLQDLSEGIEPEDETEPGPATVPDSLEGALDDNGSSTGGGRWVNVNGEWRQVQNVPTPTTDAATPSGDSQLPPPEQMITQRVIEIDARELMKGVAYHNIVVRPGDIIRVPAPQTGNIYIGGEIARPGTYALPGERELTLKQAIISAGGLGPLAIPERVDLIRRIDRNTEATVRLNARAIFEGVQPDIYLKPNDTINIGTNIWAAPLAVVRNGFRFSYGFGFLLDRNFGSDVFGPIPTDRR